MIINEPLNSLYYVINILAILVGIVYILLSFTKEKIEKKKIISFIILFLLACIFFGKLYTMIVTKEKISFFKAGLSSYGGLTGAILFTYIYEKFNNLKNVFIKYTILALPLIYGLSKFSCFIIGCCHGIEYSGPFSIKYAFLSEETYFPIQLLEIIIFMIIFLICNKYKYKKNITYITLTLISFFKFIFEYLRYDHINKIITHNQIFSLILFLITIVIFIINKKNKTFKL